MKTKERIIKYKPDKKKLEAYIKKKVLETDLTSVDKITVDFSDILNEGIDKIPEPKIQLTPIAYTKIMALVLNTDKELAWHGPVTKLENNTYVISDITIYPQIVTSTTVDADESKYTEWLMGFKEQIKSIRMQGHSHVQMGTSPSGPDLAYYSDMMKNVKDYYIFMIANKRGEMHWRFYDKEQNVLFLGLKAQIYTSQGPLDLEAWLTAENTKIANKSYNTVQTATSNVQKTQEEALDRWYQNSLPFNHQYPRSHED